jgi:hypothetical protein
MADDDVTMRDEITQLANRCTAAVRASLAADTDVETVLRGSLHRQDLVILLVKMLTTTVPEDEAARMVDELWRERVPGWCVAIQHFLEFAHTHQAASLEALGLEFSSWHLAEQHAFVKVLLTRMARATPDDILPSHYLIAHARVTEAADDAGWPAAADTITALVALCWRNRGYPAIQLAFDIHRQVERGLPTAFARLQAIAVLANVLQRQGIEKIEAAPEPAPGTDTAEPVVLTSPDASAVALRAVRLAAAGEFAAIGTELRKRVASKTELVSVLWVLALEAADDIRRVPSCHEV